MTWATGIYSLAAATFTGVTISCLWHLRWVQRMPGLREIDKPEKSAGCSVVIAARDEEARIESTIRHLFGQRGVDLEIIVVDDRSKDRTPEILRQLANEDARLHVKKVDELPEGWLGKCHACHVGASAATKQWILFTDADCWLKPDVIAKAITVGEREHVDHITLTPGTVVESVWTKSWHLMFLVTILSWISKVNRDRSGAFMGIGAFNLVRAPVYREIGGYERLRLTVLDDMKLGLLVRRAGKRTRAFLGVDDVECHWGTSVRNMIKVMEKNYFAAIDFRTEFAVGALCMAATAFAIVVAGLLNGTAIGMIAGLSPLLGIVPAGILAKRLGWSLAPAFGTPFMFPVFMYALLNSTLVTLRQGGVRWRDTFYPLKTLRAGTVR